MNRRKFMTSTAALVLAGGVGGQAAVAGRDTAEGVGLRMVNGQIKSGRWLSKQELEKLKKAREILETGDLGPFSTNLHDALRLLKEVEDGSH